MKQAKQSSATIFFGRWSVCDKRGSKKPELRHQSISFSEHNEVKFISPRKKEGKRELFYSKMDVEGFRIDVEQERMDAMLADANLALGMKF
jgi:hypothetical protein